MLNYVGIWEKDGYQIPNSDDIISHNVLWGLLTRFNMMSRLANVTDDFGRSVIVKCGEKMQRLLELGCDWGHAWTCFEPYFAEVYGVDVDKQSVEIGKASGKDIRLRSMDDTGFPDEYFDVVISAHVLEHGKTARDTLTEIYRVTKPGGWSVHTLPCTPDNVAEGANNFHTCCLGYKEWKVEFIRAGFEILTDYFSWATNQEEWNIVSRRG